MTKSVRVYYAAIPKKNKKEEKRLVLKNFHQGVKGDHSEEVFDEHWEPSDLAVIQGWVHKNSKNTQHLNFRKLIIDKQKSILKHTLIVDSNLFLYRDKNNSNSYLRFSLDGVFPTTGNYFTKHVRKERWQQIKNDLNFDLQPWRTSGDHILICLQRNGGWSMDGVDSIDWCKKTVTEIQKYTNRPIIIRSHPGDRKTLVNITGPNISISKNEELLSDFKNCHAVITYNSSPGVAAAIEGIPVFVTDKQPQRSQAFDVCNIDISNIENPTLFDRQNWIEKISMSHFNFNDLKYGIAWEIIKEYVYENSMCN